MMGLTKRQAQCLQFLREEAEAGRPVPSYTDIAKRLGIKSRGNIARLMDALANRGVIRRHPRRARSVELLDPDDALKVSIRPVYWDKLVRYADLTHASIETAVNQFVRDGLENA